MPDAEFDQRVKVAFYGTGKTPYFRVQPGLNDAFDCLGVRFRHARESSLDPADAEVRKAACNIEFLLRIEYDTDSLLTVSQGRVIELHGLVMIEAFPHFLEFVQFAGPDVFLHCFAFQCVSSCDGDGSNQRCLTTFNFQRQYDHRECVLLIGCQTFQVQAFHHIYAILDQQHAVGIKKIGHAER